MYNSFKPCEHFELYKEYNLKPLNTFGFSCIAKHMLVIQDISKIEYIFTELKSKYNLDINEIVVNKIEKNNAKYPVDKAKGSAKKYNEL